MKKKIDATENPSRLENASARALSADRSEQASRPGTFSTMMCDRVIFSSASARIVAAEQVKGNKIAAMKPGADTSLASAANWKTTNGSNLSFGNFHGKSCMKTVGAGSSAGVWLDYFEDAPLCSQGRPMATSVDVFAEAPAQIRLGAADETKSIVELAEYQVGRWIRISTVLTPTGMRNFQIYNNTAGAIVYFRNAKVEFSSSPTLYTPQTQDNIWHADLEFLYGCNNFVKNDQVYFLQKNSASGAATRQYWKLVTAAGEDWIEFSSTDSEGTGEPQPGDWIAQLGNRSDAKRQSALVQEFTSEGKILVVWYEGIDSFSMTDRDRMHIGNGAMDAEVMNVGTINSSTINNKGEVETNTLNVKSRIDAGTIVATGNITTKGTLTASKIEGDFPMDIPDDLEVNTVTASGTVKALNGEFDTVTVKDKNIILNQEGITCKGPALAGNLSANGIVLKKDNTTYIELSTLGNLYTVIRLHNLPQGGPKDSRIQTLPTNHIFINTDEPFAENQFGKFYPLGIKL